MKMEEHEAEEGNSFLRPSLDISWQVSAKNDDDTSPIRCLPDLIDFNAQSNPTYHFCLQEEQRGGKHAGFTSITHRDLQRATTACAASLHKALVASQEQDVSPDLSATKPVALVLESDVNLFIYLSALLYIDVPVCTPNSSSTD